MKNNDKEFNPPEEAVKAQNTVIPNPGRMNNDLQEASEPMRLSNDVAAPVTDKTIPSQRKLEANRRNSKKSTGPKTSAGKKTVSSNAVRHGFFAKGLLIPHRDGKEDQAEYDVLYQGIREHYQPEGWLEELRIEEIAFSMWRRRRALRWESGMASKAFAEHNHQSLQSKTPESTDANSMSSGSEEMAALTDHLFLPSREELDGLLRYEGMNHRHLNHAIGELERLQTIRKGGSTRPNIEDAAKQSQEVS
jgi:hypothetical protein